MIDELSIDEIEQATDRAAFMFRAFGWQWTTVRGMVTPTHREIRAVIEEWVERALEAGPGFQGGTGRLWFTNVENEVTISLDLGTCVK